MINVNDNSNLPSENCVAPQPIKTCQVIMDSSNSVVFSWKAIEFTLNDIIGYEIEFRQSEIDPDWQYFDGNPISQQSLNSTISIKIDNLNSGEWYEFRVRPILKNGCQGLWDTSTIQQKLPVLTPFTDPNYKTWLNPFTPSSSGAINSETFFRVAPITNNTRFVAPKTGLGLLDGTPFSFVAGTSYILNGSQWADFPCSGGSVIQADKDATVFCWDKNSTTGYNNGNSHAWESAKVWHLARDFIFGAFRNTIQRFQIYSLTGTNPTIEVWKQGDFENLDVLITTLTGVSGGMITYDHSDSVDVYSFRSDQPIVIFHHSVSGNTINNYRDIYDQKVLNPPSLRVISASTRNAASSARYDGTLPIATCSSIGLLPSPPISRKQGLIPSGLPNGNPQYDGDSLFFDGFNLPIITSPGADGDGTKQTMAQDIDTLGYRIRIPGPLNNTISSTYEFIKFASPFNFTLQQFDENDNLIGNFVSNGVGPYELRFTNLSANHLFVSNEPVSVVVEVNGEDETNLWSS